VVVYGAILSIMAWVAALRAVDLESRGSAYACYGALWFVVSDSALAYDKFAHPFAGSQAVVLSTYYLAQWLIGLSVIR
jgi:uncharacterized membrane protein YhhN